MYVCVCVCVRTCSVTSNSLQPHGLFLYPWNFPGKNTGVDCHALLQGIFRTQGSKPHLLCLQDWQMVYLPLALLSKNEQNRDFPVVQWLRLHLTMQGVWIQSLVWELKFHMPQGPKSRTQKQRNNTVTNSIKTLENGPHKKNL